MINKYLHTYVLIKLPTMSITRDQNNRTLLWTDLYNYYYYYFVIDDKLIKNYRVNFKYCYVKRMAGCPLFSIRWTYINNKINYTPFTY